MLAAVSCVVVLVLGLASPSNTSATLASLSPGGSVASVARLAARAPRLTRRVTCESEDCTAVLQAAINVGADVELQPGTWVVTTIFLNNSHQRLTLTEGVHIKAKLGEFHSPSACLFSVRGVTDVTLAGAGSAGSRLSMRKADYRNASLYTKAEWRCGVNVAGSKSVTIANLTIADTGGDGIYIGAAKLSTDTFETGCRDILVQGVVTDGAYRNGLSLISGENVLVEDTQFLRTWGTAPQAGIDIEPNGCPSKSECEHDVLTNVTFRNVSSRWNNGAGFQFEGYALKSPEATAVSITVDGMIIQGTSTLPTGTQPDPLNGSFNIGIDIAAVELGGATGTIFIHNVNVSDCIQPGLEVEDKVPTGTSLTLDSVRFQNVATAPTVRWGGQNAPVLIHSSGSWTVGGMDFVDCVVEDSQSRPFFKCDSCRHPNTSAVAVKGSFTVANSQFPTQGCTAAWGAATPVDSKLDVSCNPKT